MSSSTTKENNKEKHKLANSFMLWFHNPTEKNWELASYHAILEFKSVQEYFVLENQVDDFLIKNGMFFMMKNDVEPIWEHEKNVDGGCISIRLSTNESYEQWNNIVQHFVSGNLPDNVNGINISPKRNANIIKIWTSEQITSDYYKTLPNTLNIDCTNVRYRSHKDGIEKDKMKR